MSSQHLKKKKKLEFASLVLQVPKLRVQAEYLVRKLAETRGHSKL